jgi:hypothetical protein
VSKHVGDAGDPTTIQTLLGDNYSCQRQLRSDDRERIVSARAILEYSYADLVEFVDGDIHEDPYFIVKSDNEDTIRVETYNAYKLVHHYLAALYSYNEAIRATVTAYLPEDIKFTKEHFIPSNSRGTEYTRRIMYLRGLRVAAQHGAFNDCLPVRQWNTSSSQYRIEFNTTKFSQHNRLREPGKYLRHSNKIRQKEPLKYIGSFHTTNFYPFYNDCLAWFDTY